jgi:hypothetical protein
MDHIKESITGYWKIWQLFGVNKVFKTMKSVFKQNWHVFGIIYIYIYIYIYTEHTKAIYSKDNNFRPLIFSICLTHWLLIQSKVFFSQKCLN